VLDIVRNAGWPAKYDARTFGHAFVDQWRGREDELAADDDAKRACRDGVARGELPPAAELVGSLAAQAITALARAADVR
jgi:nitronate monooxygenase